MAEEKMCKSLFSRYEGAQLVRESPIIMGARMGAPLYRELEGVTFGLRVLRLTPLSYCLTLLAGVRKN